MAIDVKDIALKLSVMTSGTEQVDAMVKTLEALAKEGGAAAPEFTRLAEELRKIGTQRAAVDNMARLEAELNTTADSFEQAKLRANELDAALAEQRAQTDAVRAAQVSAREALAATSREVRAAKEAQDLLKASSDGATKKTAEYIAENVRLGVELATLRRQQGDQRDALTQTSQALTASERALRAAGTAYQGASREADGFARQLSSQRDALNEANAAAARVGISAKTLAEAQAQVGSAFEQTRAAAQREIQAYEQLSAIQQHIAQSNAASVASAQAAAAARTAAAQQVVSAEQAQQRAAEAAALSAKLAAQQQEAAAQETAAAARHAQEALQQAFGVIGVRSAQQIEQELAQVRGALATIRDTAGASGTGLAQAMAAGEARIKTLERELRAANGQLTVMDRLSNGLNTSIGKFTAGALFANVIQNIAYQAAQLGTEAVQANVDLQKLELGLKAVYGSSQATAAQIAFLRDTAQSAGVSVGEISGAFVKFAASAQSAGIPVATVNGLFATLTKNAATLGLSGDKVADMLNALGQMAGKGVVQMEELRGQLGDALPGALPKVAQGLGITVAEMEKLARNGQLLASEVFPALQRALETGGGDVDTLSARWARFKNVMTETAQDLGQGALGKAVGGFAEGALRVLEHLAFTATLASESFTVLGKRIGIAAADIADQGVHFRGFSDTAKKAFEDVTVESEARLQALAARIEGVTTTGGKNFENLGQKSAHAGDMIRLVGDKIEYTTAVVGAATPVVAGHAAAHESTAAAAGKNAAAQGQVAGATTAAAAAAGTASTSWTQLGVAYDKVNTSVEQQVTLAKAQLDAKKAEGAATQEVARLSGDEAKNRAASASAASANAAAQAQLTAALQLQLNVLKAQLDAEIALYNASANKEEKQREAIETLAKSVQVKTLELQKNREVTESLRTEAAERRAAAETLKDNAARVNELQAAYTTATAAVEHMTWLQKQGKASTEEVTAATREAAAAERLYLDALTDKLAKLQEAARAQQAQFGLAEQTLRLALEEARSTQAVAEAKGDLRLAAEAANRVKQLEIELLHLQAQAQRAEAEASLAALAVKRQQLALEGKLTEAMKKTLEAEELSAKAKLKQAEVTEEIADRTERLARVAREAGQAAAGSVDGYDAMGEAMGRAAAHADRLGRSLRNSRGGTTLGPGEAPVVGADGRPVDGFVQKTQIGMDQDAIAVLRQKRDLNLLSPSDLAAAEAAYMAETANAATLSSINQAFVGQNTSQQAAGRARDAKAILDQVRALSERSNDATGGGSQPAPANQAGTTHTVNIQLFGGTTAIRTASAQDASNLTNVLRQLGDAAQRTTS
jgi:tape measure domain-containing protein